MAGAILLQRFHNMRYIFRGRRSTLDVSSSVFRGRRSTSDVSCCVFVGNRIGTAVRSGDRMQIQWQAWHFVTSAEIWRKASQYLWGKLQDLRFGRCHCTCLASQYLWGKLQNLDCSKLSKCQNWRKSRMKCSF